tara:strand:+ start:1170 stop:1376 length:207 start_codon:yes stop_codon:yes gene_type:complete
LKYEHKQAVLGQFVYVRLRRQGKVLTHCKVRVDAGLSRDTQDSVLRQQFGDAIKLRWTDSDSVDVEVT